MKITLTIDNGPEPKVTPQVLDELEKRDLRAVFFIICAKLDDPRHREVARRAHEAGHVVANHTYAHKLQLGEHAGDAEAVADIARANEVLRSIGVGNGLFRPFANKGVISDQLLRSAAVDYMKQTGMTCVLWNSVPRDWENTTDWDRIALEDFKSRDWSVPVIHDFDNGAMDRLPFLLDAALDAGATFTTGFPSDCIIVDQGTPTGDLSDYMRV